MLPTLAGAANRCVIPEYKFNPDQLTRLLIDDKKNNPSKYAVLLVSEGATYEGRDGYVLANTETDGFGNPKLGGIGEEIADRIKERAPKYYDGNKVGIISQKLGYLVRGGDPDTIDSVVPMAYGNLALELVIKGIHGRMIVLKNGSYGNVPLDVAIKQHKRIDVRRFYNTDRLRPKYKSMEFQPMLVMTGDN
jgi:6-phosphofructokinase 1